MALPDGFICVDKPAGFTSFDVVAKLRGITRIRRIGHAGTLDPMATGVLPVFLGRATKAIDMLPRHDKEYEARLKLGVVTDTLDVTGRVLETRSHNVTAEGFSAALKKFLGEQEQLPPMFSAVKVNGRRLYDIARSGGEATRKSRLVEFYCLELLDFDEDNGEYSIRVSCSGGTYIRSLCHDLGQRLGCGAVMTALRRTGACGFSISECFTPDELEALAGEGGLADKIRPASELFSSLTSLELDFDAAVRYQNGQRLPLSRLGGGFKDGERIAVYRQDGRFLGVSAADAESGSLKLVKLFSLGDDT